MRRWTLGFYIDQMAIGIEAFGVGWHLKKTVYSDQMVAVMEGCGDLEKTSESDQMVVAMKAYCSGHHFLHKIFHSDQMAVIIETVGARRHLKKIFTGIWYRIQCY